MPSSNLTDFLNLTSPQKTLEKVLGLGLAVIYGIVKDYAGFIRVESEPGQGTSFHIHFPALGKDVQPQEKSVKNPLPCLSSCVLGTVALFQKRRPWQWELEDMC